MRKIFSFFLGILLLLTSVPSNTAWAQPTCTRTSPSSVTTNDASIDIQIQTTGLVEGKEYWARLNNGNIYEGRGVKQFPVVNGLISIQDLSPNGRIDPNSSTYFEAKTYTISITDPEPRGTTHCTFQFLPQQASSGGTCTINFLNPTFTSNDNIIVSVNNLGGNPPDGRSVVVKREGNQLRVKTTTVKDLSSGVSLREFEDGNYLMEIKSGHDIFANTICHDNFTIGKDGGRVAPPEPPCKDGFCVTALGNISTDPGGFIKNILTILLSLAGGIALLLIIASGYRLMTSQGNPERVQAAREQLTSAIVGLLFIIFSLSILTIIGVDILKIPGFTAR